MRYVLTLMLLLAGCKADPTAVIRQMKNELHNELRAELEAEVAAVKVQNKTFEAKVDEVAGDVADMKTSIEVGNVGGGGDSITAWIYAMVPITWLTYAYLFKPLLYLLGIRKREATRADLEEINRKFDPAIHHVSSCEGKPDVD